MNQQNRLANELREYTAMKFMGDCKCGKCQLVPRELIDRVCAALRAAGSAEPVAWRRRRKGTIGNDGWIMCPLKPERDSEFELQALGVIGTATHPAPAESSESYDPSKHCSLDACRQEGCTRLSHVCLSRHPTAPAESAAKHMQTGEYHNAHVLARDVHRWRQTWENQPAGSVESAAHEEAQIGALLAMAKTEESDIDFLFSEIRPQIGGPADRNAIRSFRRRIIQVAASHTIHRAPAESVREVLIKLAVAADHAIDMRFKSATEQDDAFAKLNIASDLAKAAISPTPTPLPQAAEKTAETAFTGMTFDTIKAAFDEYRKTLTVMDKPANFDSYSQGYVAGWNAKEAAAEPTREEIIEECAAIVAPKTPRPCDCERCDCNNQGNAEAVAWWDAATSASNAILALSKPRGGTAREGGAPPCACLRSGGDPLGNCEECDPPLTAEPPAKTQGE